MDTSYSPQLRRFLVVILTVQKLYAADMNLYQEKIVIRFRQNLIYMYVYLFFFISLIKKMLYVMHPEDCGFHICSHLFLRRDKILFSRTSIKSISIISFSSVVDITEQSTNEGREL